MVETQIKESLIALLAGINRSDGMVIAGEISKLDDLLQRGRAGLDPQLVHFLERRSYAKALTFLEGDAGGLPRTACAPRRPSS